MNLVSKQKLFTTTIFTVLFTSKLFALDYSDNRLRKLGTEFNTADKALLDLSKQGVCSDENFKQANDHAAKIRAIKTEVTGLLADLKKEITSKKTELEAIQQKLNPSVKPNFLGVMAELSMNPKVILPYDLDNLVSIVNESTQISFVDSTGKRRLANNKDKAALAKDKEAKAVLANVALSFLVDDSLLRNYRYEGGAIADKNPLRLSNSKSKSPNLFFLSDAELTKFSSSTQLLTPNANVSVEAIAMGYAKNDHGALGISAAIAKIKPVVDVVELSKILKGVKERNEKDLASKKPSKEEAAVLTLKSENSSRDIVALEEAVAKWSALNENMEFPSSAAETRLRACEVANKKLKKEVKESDVPKTNESEDTGVLKNIFKHSKTKQN